MSGISYHELTQNEARDSPARRKQFLLICTLGFGIFTHSSISAGIFESVSINDDGVFDGGQFVYKINTKDYAAAQGSGRRIRNQLNEITKQHQKTTTTPEEQEDELNLNSISSSSSSTNIAPPTKEEALKYDQALHHIFLDNTITNVPSGTERFCSGVLNVETYLSDGLLESNQQLALDLKKKKKKKNSDDDTTVGYWETEYQVVNLPKVKALVAEFAATHGFITALIHQFKVYPALVKMVKEKGYEDEVVIITNCIVEKNMCTHYVPLEHGTEYLMGHMKSSSYVKTVEPHNPFDTSWFVETIVETLEYIGLKSPSTTTTPSVVVTEGSSSTTDDGGDEL